MKFFRLQVAVLALCAAFVAAVAMAPDNKPSRQPVSFNRDVRPILSEHCYKCHGPAAKDGEGDLRLDIRDSATKDRRGRSAIVPGDPAKSRVMQRVTTDNPDDVMPPADSGMSRLTADQIETLRAWIEQGAKYEKHWALIPPTAPSPPKVADKEWSKNPIDAFVFDRLAQDKLKPEPEADKATLLRRVALTLTGLQPTPQELTAFLKDKSANAYDRMVDRFLASPRYGEHQARFWLDAVRYGDTHGLHLDNERAIYPYRDWVVRAFNQDLPYDKFARWQLAGDLLPNPSTEQLIATGYVRMNPTTSEGGAIVEEFQAKNTFDRVDTTSTVFLGLTVACARCHGHKYDPISHEDYYKLFAFFNSTSDEALDGNLLTPAPTMKAPTPDEDKKLQAMDAELRSMEAKVDTKQARAWLDARRLVVPEVASWEVSEFFPFADFDKGFDQEDTPKTWKPITIEPDKDNAFVNQENHNAYLRTTLTVPAGQEYGLRFASDDGIKVWLNGTLVHSNKVLRALGAPDSVRLKLRSGANQLLVKIVNSGGGGGVRFGLGDATDARIAEVLKGGDAAAVRALYLELGPSTKASEAYRAKTKERTLFLASIPVTLIAKELDKPRPAYVLRRGEYNLPTTPAPRAIPDALGALPAKAPVNRLGFAEWLTADDNPLFARVFVNRVWQQHFGTGIVKTAEDFGNQGEWPSHPELLDYLSVRFAKDGYSLKKLHKLILTSRSFKQRAAVTPDKLRLDPENRLVSRGPRFRLDAEVLRDQALFASGLLFERPGGKGFKPYQPAGLWEEVAFQESTTAKYVQDTTREIYRRSLYLFWKRTSPHPVMLTFDAPMREMCVVRRARTNTPLQALVTMNEPAFLEASRTFAERLLSTPGSVEDRLRLAFQLALGRSPSSEESSVLSASIGRYKTKYAKDVDAAKALTSVGMSPPDAKHDPAELAAWTLTCSTLFNLDEFLTQH